jgi:hypothetical protein
VDDQPPTRAQVNQRVAQEHAREHVEFADKMLQDAEYDRARDHAIMSIAWSLVAKHQ